MSGLIRCRKFVSRVLLWISTPISERTPLIFQMGFFVISRFAIVALWTSLFILEIPLHLFHHATENFSNVALRGPLLEFQESYSSFVRRQRLAVASVLLSLVLLVAQLTYLGYTVVQFTIPKPVTAESGVININPSWDDSFQGYFLWTEFNPCAVADATYGTQGPTVTNLLLGKNIVDPTDCDVIFDYQTQHSRPGLKFSLASIPNNATITGVNFLANVSNTTTQTVELRHPTNDNLDTLTAFDGYTAIENGTLFTTVNWSTSGAKNISLGTTGINDVQARIATTDVYAIGLKTTEATTASNDGAIDSVNNATPANRPILRVTYTIPPTAPTNFGHSDNTTTSITWSWTDSATSDTSNRVHDASHNIVCTTAGDGGTVDATVTCSEGSLSANTQYTRHANVLDLDGNSDSSSASAYTSIQTPTGISGSTLTPTSITVTATGSISNLGVGQSALWFEETVTATNSGWVTTNSWQKTGLSPNTTYTFRVKARNGDGDETAFTATTDLPTLAAAPDVAGGRTTSTWYTTNPFTFTNNAAWGSGGVQYYGYAWNTSASYTFTGGESTWSDANAKCPGGACTVANTTLSQTASTDGNSWYLHVLAYDYTETGSGGEQSYGPFYFDGTAPTAPAIVNDGTGADISSQTSTTSLSANWTASTDVTSGLQKYQYAIGSTSGGTDVVAYTDNGTNTTVTVNGLTLNVGSTYYVSVRAVDVASNTSSVTTSNGVTIESGVTPTPPDTTGPTISGITTDATSTTVTIRWTTNEAATAKVEYGLTVGYGNQVERTTLATDHQLAATGLQSNTTYHFRITSVDASGNATSTVDDTFTTVAAPIVTEPTISRGVSAPTLLRPVVRDGKYPSITITGVGKGNQTLTFYVNDRAVKSVHLEGELTETVSFAVKLLANLRPTGKYIVTVTATQSDGRVSEIRQRLTFRIKAETTGEKYVQPEVISTYIVHAGDTLWKIAEQMLGDGNRWGEIADANDARYPSLSTSTTIYIGWALTIPWP